MPWLTVFGGISAGASILGGIFGASSASKSNRQQKKAYEKQKKLQKEIAARTNQHNDLLDETDYTNYMAMRDYSHETSLNNWNYGKVIQDYKYLADTKEYEKSLAIGNAQLGLNAKGAAQGIQAEQDALNEAFIQNELARTNNYSSLNAVLTEQRFNLQAENLNRANLDLAEASNMTARQTLDLERMDKMADRKSLAIQMGDTFLDLESIGLEKIGTQYDLQQLGLDSQDLGLQAESLGFDLSSLDVDRKNLDLARLSRKADRQEQQVRLQGIKSQQKFGQEAIQTNLDQLASSNTALKTSAMIQGLIAQGQVEATGQAGKSTAKRKQSALADMQRSLMALDNEMAGRYKQAAMQAAQINADASLARQNVSIDLQRIGLAEAGIDLQEQDIDIAAGKIGVQGRRLGLQQQGIGIQANRVGLAQGQLDIRADRVGSAQAQLGVQGERIGIQEAGIDVRESDLDISLAGLQLNREGIGLNEARIQEAINQAQYDYNYNEAVLTANMDSRIKEAQRNVEQIQLEREVADVNTVENIMIKPEQLPYAPEPQLPPERIFVERMEAIPGFVPPPQMQSVWAPLISGIGNAASAGLSVAAAKTGP